MTSLLDLPLELLQHVISFVAEEKLLSTRMLHEEPSDALLRSTYHPLKDLSQACRATRELCFPSLFSALKVDINSAEEFLTFSGTHSLCSQADSLVLYLDLSCQDDNLSSCNIWPAMVRTIDSVKPSLVTILSTTSLFRLILPYDLDLNDEWAFRIPYQVLQLRLPKHLAASSHTSRQALESQNVFQIREWTHCTFNQGSSINGYCTYEYYLKLTPTIFDPLCEVELKRKMTEGGFANLTSLDYIALFPINCTMERFCTCMQIMKKLRCLRVQFAPTPSNDVLDDSAAVGKCQPGDLWQEFEDCYKTLTRYFWRTWDSEGTLMDEFISLDYVNPRLRELLDRVMGLCKEPLGCFRSDSCGGRWIRAEEYRAVLTEDDPFEDSGQESGADDMTLE